MHTARACVRACMRQALGMCLGAGEGVVMYSKVSYILMYVHVQSRCGHSFPEHNYVVNLNLLPIPRAYVVDQLALYPVPEHNWSLNLPFTQHMWSTYPFPEHMYVVNLPFTYSQSICGQFTHSQSICGRLALSSP